MGIFEDYLPVLLPTPNAYDWNVPEHRKAYEKRKKYQAAKGVNLHLPLKTLIHIILEEQMTDSLLPTPSAMDATEKDTLKMAAKLLMGKNKRSSGQPIQKSVSMALSMAELKANPEMIKELSDKPYLKRTKLPSKEIFLSWIRLATTRKKLEATGVPRTMIDHWFRKDNCFSYPSIAEWEKIKTIMDVPKEMDEKMTYQENKDWKPDSLLPTPTGQEVEHPQAKLTKTGRRLTKDGKNSHSLNIADKIALSSPAASPASLFPKPGKDEAQRTTAFSGRRCYELYESSSRHGSSLKTCVAYLLSGKVWYSNKCALTWKEKVTKSNRLLFQLSPKTHRTEGIGYGFALTPSATNIEPTEGRYEKRKAYRASVGRQWTPGGLSEQVAMLPTPTGCDHKSRGPNSKQGGIDQTIKMLPTPAMRDYKGAGKPETRIATGRNMATNSLTDAIEVSTQKNGSEAGSKSPLKLAPEMCEWMMGFPKGYTDLRLPDTGSKG